MHLGLTATVPSRWGLSRQPTRAVLPSALAEPGASPAGLLVTVVDVRTGRRHAGTRSTSTPGQLSVEKLLDGGDHLVDDSRISEM
jgi:hypothetical protein